MTTWYFFTYQCWNNWRFYALFTIFVRQIMNIEHIFSSFHIILRQQSDSIVIPMINMWQYKSVRLKIKNNIYNS